MNRVLRIARALALPLLALAGLTLLVWGVGSWQAFYRDLFLEEVAAIEALAGKNGVVEYRRQGETSLRWFDATKSNRECVPWSVPFVGRVESAKVVDPIRTWGYPPEEARDRVLRLPGMRAYSDPALSYGWESAYSGKEVDDLPALASVLPRLPRRTLSAEDLARPLPDGEALPEDEQRTLRRQIYDAWSAQPADRPRVEYCRRFQIESGSTTNDYWKFLLLDGQRRFEVAAYNVPHDYGSQLAHLALQTDDAFCALRSEDAGWRATVLGDRDLLDPTEETESTSGYFASDPHEIAGVTLPGLEHKFLGAGGERIERIERVDDERYRLVTRPLDKYGGPRFQQRLDAVVRRDLDWGIERYDVIDLDDGEPRLSQSGVVRLGRIGGEPVIEEALRCEFDVVLPGESPPPREVPEEYELEQIATVFDPAYPESLLDPRTYEADLPRPRTLPAHRTYRYLIGAGAALLIAAIGGLLFVRAQRLSQRRAAEGTPPARFTLRFGLATLFVAALLVISFAGWFKRHLDDARDQLDLLAALSQDGARVRVERWPPAFPWAFVSTDALPLGAPLKSVAVSQPPSGAALDRLLRLSPAVVYVCEDPERAANAELAETSPDAGAFIRQLAAIGEHSTPRRDPQPTVPFAAGGLHGRRLDDAERAEAVDRAIQAWRSAGDRKRQRHLVLEITNRFAIDDARMTIRDGSKSRVAENEYRVDWVECRDGRFLRRFARRDDFGWRLVLRRSLALDEEVVPAAALPSAEEEAKLHEPSGAADAFDRTYRHGRPVSPVGLPRAPYCVPPCLAKRVPPLDEALHRMAPEDVVAAESLDANRVRFDLRFPASGDAEAIRSSETGPTSERPSLVSWSVVARPDFDWAIERCDYVDEFDRDVPVLARTDVPFPDGGGGTYEMLPTGEMRRARHRRTVKILNSLDVEGDTTHVSAQYDVQERDGGRFRSGVDGSCRYRVDLAPDVSDAVFDRATVEDPDPPVPEERFRFPWYFASAAMSVLALAVLSARRSFFRRPTLRSEAR